MSKQSTGYHMPSVKEMKHLKGKYTGNNWKRARKELKKRIVKARNES